LIAGLSPINYIEGVSRFFLEFDLFLLVECLLYDLTFNFNLFADFESIEFFFELNFEVCILHMILILSVLISCSIGLLCLLADLLSEEVHFDF